MSGLAESSRQSLITRKLSLLRRVHETEDEQSELAPNEERDWPDRACAVSNEALLEELGEHERRELVDIDSALERMSKGTWGRCETCGGPIGRQRLMAMPEARQCLECRTQEESGR